MTKRFWFLAIILLISALVRFWNLGNPSEFYFDEVYHAFTAGYYADNDPKGYEWWHQSPREGTAFEWLHPPLAKLLQAGSIVTFGDVSWAWRMPSAVFGVAVIAGVYFLAVSLFGDWKVGLVASGVASMDGLLLTMSRITMNDIFVTFFILMAVGSYWRYLSDLKESNGWLMMAGVMTGLAVASKWSGVFVVGLVGVWELRRILVEGEKVELKRLVKVIVVFGLLPGLIYVLSYGQFWLQGHSLEQFRELHKQIWWYQTNLDATHPYQSRPWEWVLNLKPVWMFVDYSVEGKVGNIYAMANPIVAWFGLAAMGMLVWKGVKNQTSELLFLGMAYLAVWMAWIGSPRIMFFYHYTPAMVFLSVASAKVLVDWWKKGRVWRAGLIMGLMVGMFVWYFPYWTGIRVPREWWDLYMFLYEFDLGKLS